jgi:Xaa-Pro dipeptidase
MAIPRQPAFEPREYQRRLENVQRTMARRRLDVLLLFGPHNICYLSGMDSENLFDFQCLIVPASGEPTMVIFEFEMGRYENSCSVTQVKTYDAFEDPVKATLAALPARTGRIAVEQGAGALSVGRFRQITEGLRQAEIEDALGLVEESRLVKSAAELAYMRRAAELTDAGMAAGVAVMAPGKRDHDVAAAITAAMYGNGGETSCWGPIVAAGYRAGCAHSTFNGYELRAGDTIFLEVTGEMRRYVGPLMRTAVLGVPNAEIRRVASIVESTVDLILEKSRAGVKASDVAKAALANVEPLLGSMIFHHYFGYPVGLGYPPTWIEHLGYFVRVDNDRPLEAGMVFHLPMSFRKYGEYAVNLSQTMLVGEPSSEPLSKTPARLQVVPI